MSGAIAPSLVSVIEAHDQLGPGVRRSESAERTFLCIIESQESHSYHDLALNSILGGLWVSSRRS